MKKQNIFFWIIGAIVIGLALIVTLNFLKKKIANPIFDLNDKNATYKILKCSSNTQFYCLEKTKDDKHYFTHIIGKSLRDLEPFINKDIQIKGIFNPSTQQCIQEKCTNFNKEEIYSVDIDEITFK